MRTKRLNFKTNGGKDTYKTGESDREICHAS